MNTKLRFRYWAIIGFETIRLGFGTKRIPLYGWITKLYP